MKLIILTLLAIYCSIAVNKPLRKPSDKLQEIMENINLGRTLMDGKHMISTPPQSTEDNCCLTALRCFRSSLGHHLNSTVVQSDNNKSVQRLIRGLKSNLTEGTMHFCNSSNATTTCRHACEMHPKENDKEFFDRLESLIQKAYSHLMSA